MKAVLVSIEGTLGDARARQPLAGTPEYTTREELLKDVVVPDSARCLRELARKYRIVYLAARPESARAATEEWLRSKTFPDGPVRLAATQAERIALASDLKTRFDFIAGIGSSWSDNELHLDLGCASILLKENEGHWDTVRKHLLGREHTALQTADTLLAPWAKATTPHEPYRLDVMIEPADVFPAVRALEQARWGYLSAISGLDHPGQNGAAGSIEVLYHFCSGAAVVTLRTHTPRDAARVPSICGVIPSAGFFERELGEMFGVTVDGLPDPSRLFLPDDWPDGVYPLRKEFGAAQGMSSD